MIEGEWRIILVPEIELRGRLSPPPESAQAMLLLPAAPDDQWRGWRLAHYPERITLSAGGEFQWSPSRLLLDPPEAVPTPMPLLILSPDGRIAIGDVVTRFLPGEVLDAGTLALEPGLTLTGHVLTAADAPVPHASVRWEGGPDLPDDLRSVFRWTAQTGADGAFTLTGLPPGHWRVLVAAPRCPLRLFEIDLPSAPVEFHLEEPPHFEATVRVRGPRGEPLVGASTSLRRVDAVEGTDRLITDALGESHHPDMRPGRHLIFVEVADGAWDMWYRTVADLEPDSSVVTVDLHSLPVLRGSVTRGAEPAAGLALWVRRGDDMGTANQGTVMTDSRGEFSVPLPPGHHWISLGLGAPVHDFDFTGTERLSLDLEAPR